jgi:hypothetical protein
MWGTSARGMGPGAVYVLVASPALDGFCHRAGHEGRFSVAGGVASRLDPPIVHEESEAYGAGRVADPLVRCLL